ncbi:MAG TPA: radical SAM protein [Dehalococcoidales bacterium]
MKLHEIAYLGKYGFKTFILKQKKPIIAGIPLTDVCNLKCQHCVVANTGRGHYPWSRIEQLLRHFYDIGVRILYIQGGEVMTWRDGNKEVTDVIRRAHEIGFFKVAVVTNGTLGLPEAADLLWVSIDGSEGVHDSIRGAGTFATVMRNLEKSQHKRINLNMTINRLNAGEVEAVAAIAARLPSVHVSFNFHTPYPGVEDLCLPLEERAAIIDRILKLKRQGLPVLNTAAGLKALQKNKWRRPVPLIHLVEKDRIFECCWGREQPGVCEKCGYGIVAELSHLLNGNVATILHSLDLFK